MFAHSIHRYIHSIIRTKRLKNIMYFLALSNYRSNIQLHAIVHDTRVFLQKESEDIFLHDKEKYIVYLEYLKEKCTYQNTAQTTELLYKLYECPKKRNNPFLVLLFSYYTGVKKQDHNTFITECIYLYLLFITYRNRATPSRRMRIVQMEDMVFRHSNGVLKEKMHTLRKKIPHVYLSLLQYTIIFLLMIFGIFILFHPSFSSLLRTDVNAATTSS